MGKMRSHKGISKRFKKSNPKKGKIKLLRQSKGRGSKHLKTKQTNARKRRIRKVKKTKTSKSLKRATRSLK